MHVRINDIGQTKDSQVSITPAVCTSIIHIPERERSRGLIPKDYLYLYSRF